MGILNLSFVSLPFGKKLGVVSRRGIVELGKIRELRALDGSLKTVAAYHAQKRQAERRERSSGGRGVRMEGKKIERLGSPGSPAVPPLASARPAANGLLALGLQALSARREQLLGTLKERGFGG
jgi:hypothetical protein